MKNTDIKITERGWPGHYILSYLCNFRRNTLIEYDGIKVIVSTVGNKRNRDTGEIETTAIDTYYETLCFYSSYDEYDDIDASREIGISGKCRISKEELEKRKYIDNVANDMHDNIVKEIIERIIDDNL